MQANITILFSLAQETPTDNWKMCTVCDLLNNWIVGREAYFLENKNYQNTGDTTK